MLACARIGAVHSVVFGGFSPDSLVGRIQDCDSNYMITADEGLRGGRRCRSRANADQALKSCPSVKKVLVVKRTGGQVGWVDGRDVWYHDEVATVSAECPPTEMGAEDPLFILYTSGSTGKPKGVLHTTGGYLVYTSMTHQYVFDYHDGDIYWCTADVGWVTGHSYILYGPLANGATTLMFEGVPNYPDHLALLAGHRQAQGQYLLYRAHRHPRADARRRGAGEEDQPLDACVCWARWASRSIPEAWLWYHHVVGDAPLPDRRHLVADGNRRHSHHAAAGRHSAPSPARRPSRSSA